MGTLYVVTTPIGNLEDITLRALRVLGEVSLIAAEGTRTTRKLLTRYDLHVPLVSYNEHNSAGRTPRILQALAGGDVALVSDAGAPGVSDPGSSLVRDAAEHGHTGTGGHHAYLPPRASNLTGTKPTSARAASTPTSRMGRL